MSMTPHPGTPVVRGDLFTDDGSEYVVVMNWIDGTDLQHLLDADGAPGLALDDVIETWRRRPRRSITSMPTSRRSCTVT